MSANLSEKHVDFVTHTIIYFSTTFGLNPPFDFLMSVEQRDALDYDKNFTFIYFPRCLRTVHIAGCIKDSENYFQLLMENFLLI